MDEPGRYYVMLSEISNANAVCYHLYLKSKIRQKNEYNTIEADSVFIENRFSTSMGRGK